MKKIVCDTYEDVCDFAANIYTRQLKDNPESVLGLATGSTPIDLYNTLVQRSDAGEIDFSRARTFNLDEYYPIKSSHPQSYYAFMEKHLFSKVKFASTRVLNGEASDPHAECVKFDEEIKAAGGFDLLLLGIGVNGHIAFIEPDKSYPLGSYLVELAQDTLTENSRFFKESEIQPRSALSMGLSSIFSAKHIIMLVTGAKKADIIKKLFEGVIHTDVPASLLHLHPNVSIIVDKAANGE
jgi:glucosamine-6-phosphate deaminase